MSVCALVGSTVAMADDALSTLISDNKVWNHHMNTYYQDKIIGINSYSLCCNGTVEKNEREYTVVAYVSDNKELAYIREEDGKLYISSESPVFEMESDIHEPRNLHPSIANLSELPVFDFNAREGETFPGLINYVDGYYVGEIEVRKVEKKNIGDQEICIFTVYERIREQYKGKEFVYECGEEKIVKGIGYLNGWFFMPDAMDRTTSGSYSYFSLFDSLTDRDGNVIITENQIFPPMPPQSSKFGHTIRNDRTWVYSYNKDGVEQIKTLRYGKLTLKENYGLYYPMIDEKGETVAHMAYDFYTEREDHPIVSRFAQDSRGISEIFTGSEFDVYSFADFMPEYETFVLANEDGKYRKAKVTVESMETVEIAGEKCRREVVKVSGRPNEKFVVIEGIGANTGWLYEPAWGNPKAYEANGLATLKEVLDSDGNVIFRYEDFGPTGAVEGIEDDCAAEADTRMFDLFGREIRDPQPGMIYVQGGRKFVAR